MTFLPVKKIKYIRVLIDRKINSFCFKT